MTTAIATNGNTTSTKQRSINIDVIKALAIACVIGVHFFFNAGFNDTVIGGVDGYIAMYIRTACSICVPLFLMATGYLMKNKKLSGSYYIGIVKILVLYLACAIISVIYKNVYLGADIGFWDGLWSVTGFTANKYSWYVEMYIGLFMIIPFLNLMYDGLTNQRNRQAMLLVLAIVIALPSQLNAIHPIIPDWWTDRAYPVLFYMLGAYLRDYKLRMRVRTLGGLFLAWVALCAGFNFWMTMEHLGGVMGWQEFTDWDSIQNVVSSTLIFALLVKVDFSRLPDMVKSAFTKIASWTLAAYLLSWLFDNSLYPFMLEWAGGTFQSLFPYYLLVVIALLTFSLVTGALVTWVCDKLTIPLTSWLRAKISAARTAYDDWKIIRQKQ